MSAKPYQLGPISLAPQAQPRLSLLMRSHSRLTALHRHKGSECAIRDMVRLEPMPSERHHLAAGSHDDGEKPLSVDTAPQQVRCPDCRKRLFDLVTPEDAKFDLLIVCRCRQRFRVVLPNPECADASLPLLVRA